MTRGLGMQTLGTAIVLCSGLPAMAGGFGFSFGYAGSHHGRPYGVNVVVARPAPVIVGPAPIVVAQPVWVPPVYRTVCERVWVPTVQTTLRDVPIYDRWGRFIAYRREAIRVPSGYWTETKRQVLVRQGYWTTPVTDSVVVTAPQDDPGGRSGEAGGDVAVYQDNGGSEQY
jgi:hypothetical protein